MRERGERVRVVVLLAGLLLLAIVAAGCEDTTSLDDEATISVPFQFQQDATGRTAFQLIGVNGEVVVTGVAEGESVVVSGFRRVVGCGQEDADVWIDELEVRVTETEDEIIVQTIQPVGTSPCTLVVDYELSVPQRLAGEIVNVNGPVSVTSLSGGVTVTSVNGPVTLDDGQGDTTVRLTNGAITADLAIEAGETIDLLTVNGEIDLSIPVTTSAILSAILVNGTIDLDNLTLSNASTSSTSLTGTLGDGAGAILLRTTNGNISITGV